jgi:hypothetical protein
VATRRLNEQVRRNRKRFPDDFLFELTTEEFTNLKSHFATSSWGGRRKLARLERSLIALDLKTQRQFKEVYDAIRALMSEPPPKQRPIGFTADLEQKV